MQTLSGTVEKRICGRWLFVLNVFMIALVGTMTVLSMAEALEVWNEDDDGDGILNILDVKPQSILEEAIFQADQIYFKGRTLANPILAPYISRTDAVETVITHVEFRINGLAWLSAQAVDGAFDHFYEGFIVLLPKLPNGNYRIEVRSTNSLGNVETLYSYQDITITGSSVVDAPPFASFAISPEEGSLQTRFSLNAQASADIEDSSESLQVRWDYECDGTFDTPWQAVSETVQIYCAHVGENVIAMEIRDSQGQIQRVTKNVLVCEENLAPMITCVVKGIEGANVHVSAEGSCDPDDSLESLKIRWKMGHDSPWAPWMPYGEGKDAILTVSPDSQRYSRVFVQLKDIRGQCSEKTLDVWGPAPQHTEWSGHWEDVLESQRRSRDDETEVFHESHCGIHAPRDLVLLDRLILSTEPALTIPSGRTQWLQRAAELGSNERVAFDEPPLGVDVLDGSEYMLGSVFVTVVLLESNGSIDTESEDWTEDEIRNVREEILEGLNWWEETLRQTGQVPPRHNLEFIVDFTHADQPVETGVEPIRRSYQNQNQWINSFLNDVGFNTPLTIWGDLAQWNHDQRVAHNTHWAYTVFVVDSSQDRGGAFRDGLFAYAYLGRGFLVMTYDNGGWGINNMGQVLAHETGHIFYALDEYFGSMVYTQHSGYYNTQNLNAATGHPDLATRVASIMAEYRLQNEAWFLHTSSPSSLEMIGWRDEDNDGIFDVLDVPLLLDSFSVAFDPSINTYFLRARSQAQTLRNLNPNGQGYDITLNRVGHFQYRLDDGVWTDGPVHNGVDADILFALFPEITVSERIALRAVEAETGIFSNDVSASVDSFLILDPFFFEQGLLNVDQPTPEKWYAVDFRQTYQNPVVIMTLLSTDDEDPAHIRIRNVTGSNFEFKIEEWNYQDGIHGSERISYIVMEAGRYVLENGAIIEAGTHPTTHVFSTVSFSEIFPSVPVILTQCQSFHETDAVVVRQKNATAGHFEMMVQEEEKIRKNGHVEEMVGYIAIEPSYGRLRGLQYSAMHTSKKHTHVWRQVGFPESFNKSPLLFTAMQSTFGMDTAGVRAQSLNDHGVELKIEEESSANRERSHATEVVGCVAFENYDSLARITADPSQINFELLEGALMTVAGTVTLTNIGETAFQYQIQAPTEPWLSIAPLPLQGVIPGGASKILTIIIDAVLVEGGVYQRDIVLQGNSLRPIAIPVHMNVTGINDAPVITGQYIVTTPEDTPWTIRLEDLDVRDPDNTYPDDFTLHIQSGENYSVQGDEIYPSKDFYGALQVNVLVKDGQDESPVFPLTVYVTPENDAPVIVGTRVLKTQENTPLTIHLTDLDVEDPDNTYPNDFTLHIYPGGNYTIQEGEIYPVPGFSGSLQVMVSVRDGRAHSDIASLTVEVEEIPDEPFIPTVNMDIPLEAGLLIVDQPDRELWHSVDFKKRFEKPVVIMNILSANDEDPAHIRIRNVTDSNFEFKIEEWDYQDGIHGTERVSYLVMESGHYLLENGSFVEVGTVYATANRYRSLRFSRAFNETPVILNQCQTAYSAYAVAVRQKRVTPNSVRFTIQMQEDLKRGSGFFIESVGYIAMEASRGTLAGFHHNVIKSPRGHDHTWQRIFFLNILKRCLCFLPPCSMYPV